MLLSNLLLVLSYGHVKGISPKLSKILLHRFVSIDFTMFIEKKLDFSLTSSLDYVVLTLLLQVAPTEEGKEDLSPCMHLILYVHVIQSLSSLVLAWSNPVSDSSSKARPSRSFLGDSISPIFWYKAQLSLSLTCLLTFQLLYKVYSLIY